MGHARALLPLEGAQQVSLAQKIAIQQLSVRDAEKLPTQFVLAKKSSSKAKQPLKVDPDLKMIQDKLSDQINLAVEIKP